MFVLRAEQADRLRDAELSDHDWQFMAETEAVLTATGILAMKTQKQSVNSNILSYYLVAETRARLRNARSFKVIDCGQTWGPDTRIEDLPRTRLNIGELSQSTQTLITRFETEFNNYFPEPDSDQLLMMSFHPVMVNVGFR
jgi:hypothetical protein